MTHTCVLSPKVTTVIAAITKVVSTVTASGLDCARLWQLKKSYCRRQMDRSSAIAVAAATVVVGNCCLVAGHELCRIKERSKTSCGSPLWAEMHCSD